MTWLLVAAFAFAAFYLGRGWQAVKTEERIDFLISEVEAGIDVICQQQALIRKQRDALSQIEGTLSELRAELNWRKS